MEVNELLSIDYLSDEQKIMVGLAKEGYNVLVDACIGSGKTTSIQVLCNELSDKNILYLTYNHLLKIDAKNKIRNRNVHVQNYHGFAYGALIKAGINCGMKDIMSYFNKYKPPTREYDVLVLDEYQDIEQDLSELLWLLKERNPYMQIIAVGDMCQKIYDKTTLNVPEFIDEYLDDYEPVHFTKCFRLSADLAASLGRIWHKEINGVNDGCKVRDMNIDDVKNYLATKEAKDVLCLGARTGAMSDVLNFLEECYSGTYNKKTVYASIKDEDRTNVQPNDECAIFTTYDASKGLERPICVVFDYDYAYWQIRLGKSGTKYEILRNIFCVAASRGKDEIIFVKDNTAARQSRKLTEEDILKHENDEMDIKFREPFFVSEMFDFKYKEDVEQCYNLLSIVPIEMEDKDTISIKNYDNLIDLSPCIGIYQESSFFSNYDIDEAIDFAKNSLHRNKHFPDIKPSPTEQEKVLYLTMCETTYDRYISQVKAPFINETSSKAISDRLSTVFNKNEIVQRSCEYIFYDKDGHPYQIKGILDVLKGDIVYELKFVNELSHENYLQAAVYGVMLGLKRTRVWNTKKNEMFEITVPSKKRFMNAVVNCITKGAIKKDYRGN